MVAPTPVSSFLHAVAVVKAGVFGILRVIFFIVGPSLILSLGLQFWLMLAASITILIGSLMALSQDNFKLRLAYSTISQLSYIILGAALLTPMSLMGSLFQIVAHSFAKLTMFFVAGTIFVKTGKTKISQLGDIGKNMPLTVIAFTLATISMVGLPLTAGFISESYLNLGALNVNQIAIVFLLVISSILNATYFFPIVFKMLPNSFQKSKINEIDYKMLIPLTITAISIIVLGIWTSLPYGPFQIASYITKSMEIYLNSFDALLDQSIEYSLLHMIHTLVTISLTIIFFFVIGKKIIAPHNSRIKYFDAFYKKFDNCLLTISRIIVNVFAKFYIIIVDMSSVFFSIGRVFDIMENRDVNWNLIAFAILLLLIFVLIMVIV
jgi:formate hydrogenlyase subunit 3/multisubunit Na+/H+ antiporter MnhD subunit